VISKTLSSIFEPDKGTHNIHLDRCIEHFFNQVKDVPTNAQGHFGQFFYCDK
jgi:hypothetical protein